MMDASARARAGRWEVTACSAPRAHIARSSRSVGHFFLEETFPLHEDGMEIIKFEDLPHACLVQCYLKYPIVAATDVEQDIVSFD